MVAMLNALLYDRHIEWITFWAELLEAWLALTSVKYHDNLMIYFLVVILNSWEKGN